MFASLLRGLLHECLTPQPGDRRRLSTLNSQKFMRLHIDDDVYKQGSAKNTVEVRSPEWHDLIFIHDSLLSRQQQHTLNAPCT